MTGEALPDTAQGAIQGRAIQVCFLFNAQRHQLLHGIATAVELARMPGFEVHVVSPAQSHVDYAREVAERLGGAPIHFVHARSWLLSKAMDRTGSVVPPKVLTLAVLARWLNTFDAICLPERTSMLLKRMGVVRPRFIHLDHGAGDRAAGFDKRIRQFDFVLVPGTKHRERLLAEHLVTPDNHEIVGYPKFEAADAIRDPDWYPFEERRPVILYNPHFSALGSWSPCVLSVLEAFAVQGRYNLLLAPHVRLLDSRDARERWGPMLDRFDALPHIHVDHGSDRAIDMTHTGLADLYLGDVSSQVYEFLRRPRPCLFLNPHGVDWVDDENYAHWHFGDVIPNARGIVSAVDRAFERQRQFLPVQAAGMARTFAPDGGALPAARAIARYLEQPGVVPAKAAPLREWGGRERKVDFARVARGVAVLMLLVAGGWVVGSFFRPADAQQVAPSWEHAPTVPSTTASQNRLADRSRAGRQQARASSR